MDTSETHLTMQNAHDIAQATAQLRAEHKRETSGPQRGIDRLTALVGRPGFVGALATTITLWIIANLAAAGAGLRPVDPAPFSWMQCAASIGALLIAALILTTQRREDQLATHGAQLILELAVLNDQKSSKIIELLEEYRRDNPSVANRIDNQASAMSTPSDPQAVLGAIKEVQEDLA